MSIEWQTSGLGGPSAESHELKVRLALGAFLDREVCSLQRANGTRVSVTGHQIVLALDAAREAGRTSGFQECDRDWSRALKADELRAEGAKAEREAIVALVESFFKPGQIRDACVEAIRQRGAHVQEQEDD